MAKNIHTIHSSGQQSEEKTEKTPLTGAGVAMQAAFILGKELEPAIAKLAFANEMLLMNADGFRTLYPDDPEPGEAEEKASGIPEADPNGYIPIGLHTIMEDVIKAYDEARSAITKIWIDLTPTPESLGIKRTWTSSKK